MTAAVKHHALLLEQLHSSICLLRLLAERPPELDEVVSDHEEGVLEKNTIHNADNEDGYPEEDLEDMELIRTEAIKKRNPKALRNKLLDRLAEILARYKSDRKVHKRPTLDPKHVSSTMMVVDEEHNKVKIICAKNEGLDQHNSTNDTDFLSSWKASMERVARQGAATKKDRFYMLDMILKYQQPRITYYLDELKKTLRSEEPTRATTQDKLPKLSDEWLQNIPAVRPRSWIDDNDNEFMFSGASIDGVEKISQDDALSLRSFKNITNEVDSIFELIDQVVSSHKIEDECLSREILMQLLPSLFSVWRSPRFQASIKARLHVRFQDFRDSKKRKNDTLTALKYLCRVYYSVDTFIQAAESMPIFKSVECIPIPPQPAIPTKTTSHPLRQQATPLQIAKSLELHVSGAGWLRQLEKEKVKNKFREFRGGKCQVHAEIQLLSHQTQLFNSRHEDEFVHPYIGCSKLCCFFCWHLLRVHGTFNVRGTHETVMHRWGIPTVLSEAHNAELQAVLRNFLDFIKNNLQNILNKPFPLKHPENLAQSSAALSTTQTALDREKAQMEKPLLNMRQLMMMPWVGDDGIIINDIHEKPGFVYVVGGSLAQGEEMTCQKAEVFKENHIRGKFRLEKTDKMPPRQVKFIQKCRCRRCHQPSSLRCCLCRTSYCSRACQKKHWSRHVFVCRLTKRPNDVDYLRIFIRKWSHAIGDHGDEWKQAQALSGLYSDDDLCKTFGFNNCAERDDVVKLLCFYTHMMSKLSTQVLQWGVEEEDLSGFMTVVAVLIRYKGKETYCNCSCMTWFLQRRYFIEYRIPNWEGNFLYQAVSWQRLEKVLSIEDWDDDVHPLSISEREVVALYSILFRDFNNIPGPLTSQWLQFGFCFCTNRGNALKLAKLYIQLADSGATLKEIARAYEGKKLFALMSRRGLDISDFQAKGILFRSPDVEELGIYRLIAEVNHTLSGHFCSCYRYIPEAKCHTKFETHLTMECDGDYGFHGTNTWERWQLFNFYKHVFDHPKFDARKMQEAKRHPDNEKLEKYLDSLIPDFRRKIYNRVLSDMMFPKLKNRVEFPNGRLACWCLLHDTVAPEGLDCFTSSLASQFPTITLDNEENTQ